MIEILPRFKIEEAVRSSPVAVSQSRPTTWGEGYLMQESVVEPCCE